MVYRSTSKTDAVIFDCDGTLLDSMPAWHRLEADLAWMAGIKLTPEQNSLLNGNTLSQTVAYFHDTYGVGRSFEQLLNEARNSLLEYYRTSVIPRKGARELLARLKNAGVRLAVASSSDLAFLQTGLKHTDMYDHFDIVASAEAENTTKRNADFFLSVIDRLQASPCRSWCIDDSLYALNAARSAGLSTIGIYDSDEAGSFSQLERCADKAVLELTELDYDHLFGSSL